MITIEIAANLLKAIQAVAQLSVKAKDVRANLHGALIDTEKQMIVSCNGHTLAAAPAHISGVYDGTDSLILDLSQAKVPAKSIMAVITISDDKTDIRMEFPGTNIAPQLLTRIKDEKYPDWERIIVPVKGEKTPYSAIGINPEYITVVGKAIGKHLCVGLQFFGDEETTRMIKVLWSNEPELIHIVMPCRI